MKTFNPKNVLFNYTLLDDRETATPGLSYGTSSKEFKNKDIRNKYSSSSTNRPAVINLSFLFLDYLVNYSCISAYHIPEEKRLFLECEIPSSVEEDEELVDLVRCVVHEENNKLKISFKKTTSLSSDSLVNCLLALTGYLCTFDTDIRQAAQNFIAAPDIKTAFEFCDTLYYKFTYDDKYTSNYEIECDDELIVETAAQMLDFAEKSFDCDMPAPTIAKKKTVNPKGKTNDVTFEDIKNGAFVVDFDWADEVKGNIPPLSSLDTFIPTKSFIEVLTKVKYRFDKVMKQIKDGVEDIDVLGKDFVNTFLLGKPGTGKTKTIFAVAAALQVPVYSVPLSKNTEEDTFQGMNKIIDGKLSFVETDTIKAFKNGGLIVFEEINLADPAVVMGCLGQAIEFPYNIHKNGYEPIQRHPLLAVFGTMNIGTYGSKGINQALSSRFKQSFILNETSKEDMINILKKSLSSASGITKAKADNFKIGKPVEIDDNLIEWTYNAYDTISKLLKDDDNEEYLLNLSTRSCIGVIESIEEGIYPLDALRIGFIGKIAESDLELAEELFNKIKFTLQVPVLHYFDK